MPKSLSRVCTPKPPSLLLLLLLLLLLPPPLDASLWLFPRSAELCQMPAPTTGEMMLPVTSLRRITACAGRERRLKI